MSNKQRTKRPIPQRTQPQRNGAGVFRKGNADGGATANSAQAASAQGNGVPGNGVPGNSVPGNSVPGNSVPGNGAASAGTDYSAVDAGVAAAYRVNADHMRRGQQAAQQYSPAPFGAAAPGPGGQPPMGGQRGASVPGQSMAQAMQGWSERAMRGYWEWTNMCMNAMSPMATSPWRMAEYFARFASNSMAPFMPGGMGGAMGGFGQPGAAPPWGGFWAGLAGQNQPAANQHAANQHAANQHAANQHAANQHAANQHAAGVPAGTNAHAQHQHAAPQYGAPQYGAPQYGAPQYGAPAGGVADVPSAHEVGALTMDIIVEASQPVRACIELTSDSSGELLVRVLRCARAQAELDEATVVLHNEGASVHVRVPPGQPAGNYIGGIFNATDGARVGAISVQVMAPTATKVSGKAKRVVAHIKPDGKPLKTTSAPGSRGTAGKRKARNTGKTKKAKTSATKKSAAKKSVAKKSVAKKSVAKKSVAKKKAKKSATKKNATKKRSGKKAAGKKTTSNNSGG